MIDKRKSEEATEGRKLTSEFYEKGCWNGAGKRDQKDRNENERGVGNALKIDQVDVGYDSSIR